jgi:hypothetical protein
LSSRTQPDFSLLARTFTREQRALALDSPAVARDRTVARNHAVTRDREPIQPPETTSAILGCLGLSVRAAPPAPARRDDGFDDEAADPGPAYLEP